jgi:phosphoribosyl 1,2-cyclic phosphate phosphodiesterase
MKIVFLGTGTSVGVPAIGCECAVCLSDDPRNKRLRSSLYVEAAGSHIVIDTSPDFRMQALTCRIPRVDAVMFTHSHADHVMGFDDIRRFNTMQDCVIPVYGSPATIADVNRIFDYVHDTHLPGLYRPRVEFNEFSGPFRIGEVAVEPMAVVHGPKPTHGYRLEAEGRTLGYFPDCGGMPDEVVDGLKGIDVMILDALRHRKHSTHFTLSRSIETLGKIGAERSFIIHMCHDLDHEETQRTLPETMFVSHDGRTVEW